MLRDSRLAAYLGRVRHDGPLAVSSENLGRLVASHIDAIPFEAIDVLLGQDIPLDEDRLHRKIVEGRRGGYCFEHNTLFAYVLRTLGYQVEPLLARVLWMLPEGAPPPAWSHMALRVTVDGVAYLVDTGFGSCTPSGPLSFGTANGQATPHGQFRLLPTEAGHRLEAIIDRRWTAVYECGAGACTEDMLGVANRMVYSDPRSLFRQTLLVTRTTPDARIVVFGNRITVRPTGADMWTSLLSAAEIRSTVVGLIGLPVVPAWHPIFERAAR